MSSAHNLGIDTLVLAKVGTPSYTGGTRASEIRRIGALGPGALPQLNKLTTALKDSDSMTREAAAWALSQMGEAASPAMTQLITALEDPDPVVRGLAALTLREVSSVSRPPLEVLVGKLKDEDPNVRLMVGGAITAQGESAAAAVPALIQACQVEGEQVHVLRSFASALGAIGPQATPSLPVLRKLETHTRIRWSARAAIRNITGKPYEPS